MSARFERRACVVAHDPAAMAEARHALAQDLAGRADLLDHLRLANTPLEAVTGVGALVIYAEWQAFKSPNFDALRKPMRSPVIFDGRNLYEPAIRPGGTGPFRKNCTDGSTSQSLVPTCTCPEWCSPCRITSWAVTSALLNRCRSPTPSRRT